MTQEKITIEIMRVKSELFDDDHFNFNFKVVGKESLTDKQVVNFRKSKHNQTGNISNIKFLFEELKEELK